MSHLQQAQHNDTPWRHINIDHPVALCPRFVEGVARAVPPAKGGVLCAQDLCPLAELTTGAHAVGMIAEVLVADVHHRQHTVVAARHIVLERENVVRIILMDYVECLTAQAGIRPPYRVGCYDEPAHLHPLPVSGDGPVEAVVAVSIAGVMPIALVPAECRGGPPEGSA